MDELHIIAVMAAILANRDADPRSSVPRGAVRDEELAKEAWSLFKAVTEARPPSSSPRATFIA